MSRVLTIAALVASFLVALALLGGLVWANTTFAQRNSGEREFLVPWLAARTYLLYGDSPYSDPATQRAQIVYYGRLAVEGEDSLRLWLPFPLELVYFPFALLPDYALARGLWMSLQEIALAALALLILRLTGMKATRLSLPLLSLFSLFWFFGFLAVMNSSGIVFIALAVAGCLLALRAGQDELAGVLLLPLLFEPGAALGLMLFLIWWPLFHRRGRVLVGLGMALALSLTLAFFFLPGWFFPFLRGLILHIHQYPGLSLAGLLGTWWPVFGPRLAWGLSALLALLLLFEWGRARRQGFRHFLWTACLSLSASPWLGLPVRVDNFLLLLLPLFLLAAVLDERWSRPGKGKAASLFLGLVFALFWGLPLLAVFEPSGALPRTIYILLPFLLITGLLWMRWWAIRPPRTSLEMQT